MLNYKTEIVTRNVEIIPKDIEIYFNEDERNIIRLILPSMEEISDFRSNVKFQLSISEIVQENNIELYSGFKDVYEQEILKYEKYGDSSTYLTKLSNYCELFGDLETSKKHAKKSTEIDPDVFHKHELAEVLIKQGMQGDAESIFSACDLNKDVHANLRLAYFSIIHNDIPKAKMYVEKANSIIPDNFKTRMFLGAINLWERDWERAILNFKIADEENSNSSSLNVNLAAAYIGTGKIKKALNALNKSVRIDPLNENAITFLSDIYFSLNKPEKAIPIIEKYVVYEQKSEGIWGRLARAYYSIGKKENAAKYFHHALTALKNQEKINSTASIWNNIAVVYLGLKRPDKAARFFMQSIKKAEEEESNISLPLYNLNGLLIENGEYRKSYVLLTTYLNDFKKSLLEDKFASRIKLQQIICLEALEKNKEASVKIEELLHDNKLEPEVKIELLIHIIYYYSTIEPSFEHANKYASIILEEIENIELDKKNLINKAINNSVFVYLLFNKIDKANSLLNRLSVYVHKEPYATATLGMFHLLKGNIEKGEKLYKESISMLTDNKAKSRFKQRMYFQIGKALRENGDEKLSINYFKKAMKQKYGYDYVNKQIKLLTNNTIH